MLIRQYSNPEETVRSDRQTRPQLCVSDQWVRLDPWENADCVEKIALACGINAEDMVLDEWNPMPVRQPMLAAPLTLVVEDPETGFSYYRSLVDSVRAEKWHQNNAFGISARQW